MLRNKKGFTLIELLSVIVLIGLLIGIGVPGVYKISDNMKKKSLDTKIELIEQAGILWGQENKSLLHSEKCDIPEVGDDIACKKVKIIDLIDEDYMDGDNHTKSLKNPVNDKDFANCTDDSGVGKDCNVFVYKKNNRVYAYFGKDSCSCIDE